jgi:hypothetical protein
VNTLTEYDIELLHALHMEGGTRLYLALSGVPSYSPLADKGCITETQLQNGSVHIAMTEVGRKALAAVFN